MSETIKTKGVIAKITRINGKGEAQVSLIVPVTTSAILPMGEVNITITPSQKSMFEGAGKKGKADKDEDEE